MAKFGAKRLGILGGTFDPVHLGHLAVARAALDTLDLDEILFIPSYKPPHKQDLTVASFAHRLAMLKLALADEPRFSWSDIEGERQELSYTIDTLKELKHRFGESVALYFLMGFDAFAEMATWKQYQNIPKLADVVVINRPQPQQETMAATVQDVFGIQGKIVQEKEGCWRLVDGGHIHELVMGEVSISSSSIRLLLGRGEEVSTMLHPHVATYVKKHGLYGA